VLTALDSAKQTEEAAMDSTNAPSVATFFIFYASFFYTNKIFAVFRL
jgi:hypothetical protein